ncbi:MAG TPA: PhoU domain-containing protein [Thermoplasmata archaeon]|nr:PhoU domain-containing protein [Thermoplasmata archaeon]
MKQTETEGTGETAPESSPEPIPRARRRDRPTGPNSLPALRPGGASRPTETGPAIATLDIGRGEPPEHVFRRLLGAYLGGAREFVLRERPRISPTTREVVRTFCRRTRQPEILSDEGGLLRLRDLAYDSPVSLPQRIERMGRLVVEFHRESVDAWARLPLGEDGYWERRDDEIDREAWYIQRLAALRLGAEGPNTTHLGTWTVARSLERIADHAVTLGETGRRLVELPNGVGPITPLKQFHRQAMEHLEGVLAVTDGSGANDLLDMGEALMASGRALSERLLPAVNGIMTPPATAAAVARILESIQRTIAYSQDIAQVVLDRSLAFVASEEGEGARPPVPAI